MKVLKNWTFLIENELKKLWKQQSILYLLEVSPLLDIGNVFQSLYGHKLSLVHTRQIQVTLVDLPQSALSKFLHEMHRR